MTDRDSFPYEYGSDLHWFWGWGQRIDAILQDEQCPSQYDWMIFRPDRLARNAMMRFSIKYPHVVKQVDDYLDFAEKCFAEYKADDNESTRSTFAGAMEGLSNRISTATTLIAQHEGVKPSSDSAGAQESSRGLSDPISRADAALVLNLTSKRIRDRAAELKNEPPPAVESSGRAHQWSYAVYRPWLVNAFSGAGAMLPEKYEDFREILDTRPRKNKVSNPG
jgi:hypothetical protein